MRPSGDLYALHLNLLMSTLQQPHDLQQHQKQLQQQQKQQSFGDSTAQYCQLVITNPTIKQKNNKSKQKQTNESSDQNKCIELCKETLECHRYAMSDDNVDEHSLRHNDNIDNIDEDTVEDAHCQQKINKDELKQTCDANSQIELNIDEAAACYESEEMTDVQTTCLDLQYTHHVDVQVARAVRLWESSYRYIYKRKPPIQWLKPKFGGGRSEVCQIYG